MPKHTYEVTTNDGVYEVDVDEADASGSGDSFGTRALNAIGPAIRGLGDIGVPFTNLDINHGLEATGLVAPGRLTGPESTERDQGTRTVSNLAGGSAITGQIAGKIIGSISSANQAANAAKIANAAKEAEAASAAARAAKTAEFMRTGLIDATPDVLAQPVANTATTVGRSILQTAADQARKHPYITGAILDQIGGRTVGRVIGQMIK
jgi:hypothetical protein